MATNIGLFTPNLPAPAPGTSQVALLRHAASVRPCARPLRGQGQKGGASERDVKIVVGPHGPVIQIQPKKPCREFDSHGNSDSTD